MVGEPEAHIGGVVTKAVGIADGKLTLPAIHASPAGFGVLRI